MVAHAYNQGQGKSGLYNSTDSRKWATKIYNQSWWHVSNSHIQDNECGVLGVQGQPDHSEIVSKNLKDSQVVVVALIPAFKR